MPRYIVKAAPDVDLYVEWSTVVDNFTWAGTREELITYGRRERWQVDPEDRAERTDREGTSAMWGEPGNQEGGWQDEQFLVTNVQDRDGNFLDGFFWLDRSDLAAYIAGDTSVLELIPDEEE